MLQITADLSSLSIEQRQAVAAFILDFPQAAAKNMYHSPINNDEDAVIIPPFVVADHSDEDDDLPSPLEAFGGGPTLVPSPPSPIQAATSIAPVVAALPALPTNGVAALDKNGLPWDERIHSGNRAKIADGSWRTKRGVDEALVAQVEAELKGLMGLPTTPTVPAPPPPLAAPVTAIDRQPFVSLIAKATNAIKEGKLSEQELAAAVSSHGVASLQLLINRLDLVPAVSATIDAMTLGR